MGFVALARPQKGMHWETLERKGTDLLLVVDTSKSMDADDVKPTRLERAKLAIRDLVDRFPGDRIGLVAFAGDAFVQSPMTLDHDALLESLDALDTSVIARGGTEHRPRDRRGDRRAGDRARTSEDAWFSSPTGRTWKGRVSTKPSGLGGGGHDRYRRRGDPRRRARPREGRARARRSASCATKRETRSGRGSMKPGCKAIAAAAHGAYRPLGSDGRGLDRLYDESLAGLTAG